MTSIFSPSTVLPSAPFPLLFLPLDCLRVVATNLPPRDVSSLRFTNRSLHYFVASNRHCLRRLPIDVTVQMRGEWMDLIVVGISSTSSFLRSFPSSTALHDLFSMSFPPLDSPSSFTSRPPSLPPLLTGDFLLRSVTLIGAPSSSLSSLSTLLPSSTLLVADHCDLRRLPLYKFTSILQSRELKLCNCQFDGSQWKTPPSLALLAHSALTARRLHVDGCLGTDDRPLFLLLSNRIAYRHGRGNASIVSTTTIRSLVDLFLSTGEAASSTFILPPSSSSSLPLRHGSVDGPRGHSPLCLDGHRFSFENEKTRVVVECREEREEDKWGSSTTSIVFSLRAIPRP